MKTKWQRQIGAVITALRQGAKKCEKGIGSLYESSPTKGGKPKACALGAIFVDGKTVSRIRSVSYDRVYREHPVLQTVVTDAYGYKHALGDKIIDLNDNRGLSFKQIIAWLRKLARRKTVPQQEWPEV